MKGYILKFYLLDQKFSQWPPCCSIHRLTRYWKIEMTASRRCGSLEEITSRIPCWRALNGLSLRSGDLAGHRKSGRCEMMLFLKRFISQSLACKDVWEVAPSCWNQISGSMSTVITLSQISMHASVVTVRTLPISASWYKVWPLHFIGT